MNEVSIKDVFGLKGHQRDVVYVVRSSPEVVVYVGKAERQCVADRMARHIGDVFTKQNPSRFSTSLLENHPDYFEWTIEILDPSSAGELTQGNYDCVSCAEQGVYDWFVEHGCRPTSNARRPNGCGAAGE